MRITAIAALTAAATLAACGTTASAPHPSTHPAAKSGAAAAAGCQQAGRLGAAAMNSLDNGLAGSSGIVYQMDGVAKIPGVRPQLRLDLARAALDLSHLAVYRRMGGPVSKTLITVNKDLARIQDDCS